MNYKTVQYTERRHILMYLDLRSNVGIIAYYIIVVHINK